MDLTTANYTYLCQLVYSHSGIDLGAGRQYLATARLEPLARSEGLETIDAVLAAVRSGAPGLAEAVVEAMTTKETSFFRDQPMWDALREHVLPTVIGARPRQLRLWSAAASTGQEAHSLAIQWREDFGHLPDPLILATDLSRPAIAKAAAGRYSTMEVNRGLPARHLVRYFDRDGLDWKVRPNIRALIDFRHLNLAAAWPVLPPMDVILLRNVLMYFDVAAKVAVLDRVVRVLAPEGFLILGGAETTHAIDDRFQQVCLGKSPVYRLRPERMAP